MAWARLYYLVRSADQTGSGCVVLYFTKLIESLDADRSSIYRWLETGRAARAFRWYKKKGNFITIYYGSLEAIGRVQKATDLDKTTEIDLEEIISSENGEKLRQRATLHRAKVEQEKSREAAKRELRLKKERHKKLAKPKFRGATGKPTSQYFPNQKNWGTTQKNLAEKLGVTDRTIRRHLSKTSRVQGYYKISKLEGQEELFKERESGGNYKPKIFERKGEYWKYGPNIYDLDYRIKSRWTARLKYKFNLLKDFRSRPNSPHKNLLSVKEFFEFDWLGELNLEKLIKIRNFNQFRKEVGRQLRERNRRLTM